MAEAGAGAGTPALLTLTVKGRAAGSGGTTELRSREVLRHIRCGGFLSPRPDNSLVIWAQLRLAVDNRNLKTAFLTAICTTKDFLTLSSILLRHCNNRPRLLSVISHNCEVFTVSIRPRCHHLFRGVRTEASTLHHKHSGRLWGALLSAFYVTQCVTALKVQPCKCHRWPSNMPWKGTDISPSPNSSFVSNIKGKHELEEIMVSRKS